MIPRSSNQESNPVDYRYDVVVGDWMLSSMVEALDNTRDVRYLTPYGVIMK